MPMDKTSGKHSPDSASPPLGALCQGSATASRRTLSGLDTDRWHIGFSFSDYPGMASRDDASSTPGGISVSSGVQLTKLPMGAENASPASEDSMRGFTQLAWKKKCVGTASIGSDLLSVPGRCCFSRERQGSGVHFLLKTGRFMP